MHGQHLELELRPKEYWDLEQNPELTSFWYCGHLMKLQNYASIQWLTFSAPLWARYSQWREISVLSSP